MHTEMRHVLNVILGAIFVLWGGALLVAGLVRESVSVFGILLLAAGAWTLIMRLRTSSSDAR
jgi:hypothetical protein